MLPSINRTSLRRILARRTSLWLLALSLVLVVGCIYAVLFCTSASDISGHAIGCDDAYISYRYARNLVRGYGPVFNPGERVEGYSNPLYVLIMALPLLAGLNVFVFSVALNIAFLLGAQAIFFRHALRRFGGPLAVLAGLLFAASPSLWLWASSGLETPLVMLLQVSVLVGVVRVEEDERPWRVTLLCLSSALLTLTRVDGFIMPAVAIAYLLAKGRRKSGAAGVLTVAATLIVLFSWRHVFYHELWPNTYYAKVSGSLAARSKAATVELRDIFAQGLQVPLLVLAVCSVRAFTRITAVPSRWREIQFDLVFAVVWIVYFVYVGGDVYEDRFLIVLIPIGISYLIESFVQPSTGPARLFVIVLALASQLAVCTRSAQFRAYQYRRAAAKYDRWIALGEFLGRTRPGRTIAVDAAGKIPYFSDLPTIDMLGLNDKFIGHLSPVRFVVGHSKYDPDYVLSRDPDLLACFFDGQSLDFKFGMSRAKYAAAGYRVRFLVNASPDSRGAGKDIVDVLGWSDLEILDLNGQGYNYGVAERESTAP